MPRPPQNTLATLIGHPDFRFDAVTEVREGLALLLIAMAIEDGELAEDELAFIHVVLMDSPMFGGDDVEARRCTEVALERAQQDDSYVDHMMAALKRLETLESRELAATMILTILASDGYDSIYEVEFAQLLMEQLEVSPERSDELFEEAVEPFIRSLRAP